MGHNELLLSIDKLLSAVEELVPVFMEQPKDGSIARGVCSVCIIDEQGHVYGKMFGTDKIRGRDSYRIAFAKASQVWITGYRTNEYERMVFTDRINPYQYGINLPDLIGWEGGQPVTLKDGTKISVGFSGFRGTSDLEIVRKALAKSGLVD
jgi:uncharacterized protein GlcG (DUF336 family)